jgi:serine protease AprX
MKTVANSKNLMKSILICLPAGELLARSMIRKIFRFFFQIIIYQYLIPVSNAQEYFQEVAPLCYRIEFTNKDRNPFSTDNPEAFLSAKSLLRRHKQGIPVNAADLPVTPEYLDSLRIAGAKVLNVSKWFNTATIQVSHDSILNKISALPFVKKAMLKGSVKSLNKTNTDNKGIQYTGDLDLFDYGSSSWQIIIHKGELLHQQGFTGHGITIAVIDAGFYYVNQLSAFSRLWEYGQILGTHDFVSPGSDVFTGHSHGMVVLSIIGCYLPGELIGTAPDADFWLLRSEDTGSELLIEEDNWVAAAEFADSAGVDIINTSLGYTLFDNHNQDHTYADMDGNTTFISRAADMAASKGMAVIVSAGNQGDSDWHYISAPADADSVLAVGAIDQNGYIASFSGRGPSSDGNVKPDIVSVGKGTWCADYQSGIRQSNGTSLSAPVITGLTACLWQANPDASAMDLLEAIRESSDRFLQPDTEYGNGVPDFNLANMLLHIKQTDSGITEKVLAFPNPFGNELYIVFKSPVDDPINVIMYDLTGKIMLKENYSGFPGRSYIKIDQELTGLLKGVYLIKITAGSMVGISKLVKF